MDKPYQEAYQLIENMAQNHYQWGSERAIVEKSQTKGGMYEVNGINHVNAKVEALSQKIESLTLAPTTVVQPNCELCGVPGHIPSECQYLIGTVPDQVNYAQGNPYSDNYNPGWRNHPNFSYKNNNALLPPNQTPLGFQRPVGQQAATYPPKKSNLDLMMEKFLNQNINSYK
jgi:hypothetical protein